MAKLLINIKKLIQVDESGKLLIKGEEMDNLPVIENAFLLIEKESIKDYGKMQSCNYNKSEFDIIDCSGKIVMPGFCDSHTHIVYAGSREIEYVDKIRGLSYEEIAKRGGGILNSAKLLHNTSQEELFHQAQARLNEILQFGTTAVEIKSGYGLNLEDELKMLRVIKMLKESSKMIIKSTFLGAHAVPVEYKNNQTKYVDLIVNEMIPKVAEENLADYIDVFCDKGFFTVEETDKILIAGKKYNMLPKIHANELANSGGIQVGVKNDALSVDHLEFVEDKEISCLLKSSTMPTVLPGAAFFLNMPYSPIRKMINSGLPVALASDYNPGSSPSGNMKFIMSLACINYKMTPNEAITACTLNSAYAMGISNLTGSISKGKFANLIITKEIPSIEFLPYAYTSNLIENVILKGEIVK